MDQTLARLDASNMERFELSVRSYSLHLPITVAFPNLRILVLRAFYDGIHGCQVELRTPSLEEFECKNDLAMAFDFAYLYSDFYAIVKFRDPIPRERSLMILGDLFSLLALVKYQMKFFMGEVDLFVLHLVVLPVVVQFLSQAFDILIQLKAMPFDNLVYMMFAVWPVVEHLHTLRGSGQSPLTRHVKTEPQLHGCKEMLNCLKYVKITNFYGNEGEMELVKCLVLNAQVLTEIRIVPPRKRVELGGEKLLDINAERWVKISEKILGFKRASTEAILSFS
ncbi:hypothetical protein RJ639_009981 [Escallonia herrerae]|uniref:FBD domain-containing protein n=1 Tax=Escallonia herrerae TaxID=1293975 RepID=A0AA89AUG7_9ASTE|nr:hypothetical protein RJ639_009981 [Escallonia herrerae]